MAKIKIDYAADIQYPSQLNGLGYRILKNEVIELKDHLKWAIEIFNLNIELFPKNGNNWDSLGEAYAKDGQIEKAIHSYEKALKLSPNADCDWCESSSGALKRLKKQQ